MRKLLVLVSVLAAACGGSSHSGGGGGGGPLAGTIGGHAFTPTDVKAVLVTTTTPCTVAGATLGAQGLAIEITSYANACGDFASSQCTFHASAETVTVLVAKFNPLAPYTPPTIGPGPYTINSSLATQNSDGSVGYAQAIVTDASCNGNVPTPAKAVTGGSITLTQVNGTGPITGSMSVTFQGGGSLSGEFSAPLCTQTPPDICALAETQSLCTTPGICVQ